MYKLGSLFDGSGGFPLAGALCGIEPSWASEVEPYPIAVTRERFPNMKHLGDISKINGAEVEPVDIITFGSPCQDLSVAGKRAGLKHEANGDEETTRSGLFMEAVRIIKEMRRATNGKYPSFALWENVPGAFSSNKGEDFRVVCEELIKIVEPTAVMPSVPKNGWPYADSYVGNGWSLAYRVFDAQYWGVPQRRRRIHLILDLRGERARKVLFEREGVRGYFTQGGKAWEGTPGNAEGSTGANDQEGETAGAYGVTTKGNGDAFISKERHTALTLGGGQAGQGYPCVMEPVGFDVYNQVVTGNKRKCLTAKRADTDHTPVVCVPYTLKIRSGCEGGGKGALIQKDKSATLATNNDQYLFQPIASAFDQGATRDVGKLFIEEKAKTLTNGTCPGHHNGVVVAHKQERKTQYIVRRLNPTECARLQGFADCWGYIEPKENLTDEEYRFWLEVRNTHAAINDKPVKDYTVKQMLTWYNKLYTDSAEYKMWGNGIALPPALYCMQGITDALGGQIPQAENPVDFAAEEPKNIICMATQQGGAEIRTDDKAPTLTAAAGMSGNNQPVICYQVREVEDKASYAERLILDEQGGQQITVREDGKAPTLRAEMHENVPCELVPVDTTAPEHTDAEELPEEIVQKPDEIENLLQEAREEDELTDLSDAPEEIKEEIMENAEKLEQRTTETTNEAPAAFNAIEQLRALAEERKALAHINTNTPRFENDVRAIEYAVSVLEAVGL